MNTVKKARKTLVFLGSVVSTVTRTRPDLYQMAGKPAPPYVQRLEAGAPSVLAAVKQGAGAPKYRPGDGRVLHNCLTVYVASSASVFSPKTFCMMMAAGQNPVNDC